MRIIALAWGVLAVAGMVLSVVAIGDLMDALKIVLVLVICTGGFLSLWFVMRERWPDIREWRMGYRISLGWYLTVFVPVFGFGVIMAAIGEAVRQPVVGLGARQ